MIKKDDIIKLKVDFGNNAKIKTHYYYCKDSEGCKKKLLQIQSTKPRFARLNTNDFLTIDSEPLRKPSVIQLNRILVSSCYKYSRDLLASPKNFSSDTNKLIRTYCYSDDLCIKLNLDLHDLDKLNKNVSKI